MANKKRLIDANAIPYEEHYVPDGDTQWEYKKELCVLKPTIDAMPTVDAVEVVHASWIEDGYYGNPFVCSHCGGEGCYFGDFLNKRYYYTKFCPNCGAKMDGGNEDD